MIEYKFIIPYKNVTPQRISERYQILSKEKKQKQKSSIFVSKLCYYTREYKTDHFKINIDSNLTRVFPERNGKCKKSCNFSIILYYYKIFCQKQQKNFSRQFSIYFHKSYQTQILIYEKMDIPQLSNKRNTYVFLFSMMQYNLNDYHDNRY